MFKQIIQEWDEYFNSISVNNPILGRIAFFIFASQLFQSKIYYLMMNEKREVRLSALIFMPSRSGKGQMLKVLEQASKLAKINYERTNEVTTASLIGSFDEELFKALIKNVSKENKTPEKMKELKGKCIIYGKLFGEGIVSIPECKNIITDKELILHIQSALDSPGWVDKDLKNANIHYQSKKSIIGTSVPFNDMKEIVTQQGLFQRSLVYAEKTALNKRNEINKLLIESTTQQTSNINFKQLKKIVDELVAISNSIEKPTTLKVTKQAQKIIQQINDKFVKELENNIVGKNFSTGLTYTTAAIELTLKLAAIVAAIDNKKIIDHYAISQVYRLVLICIKSFLWDILDFVNENTNAQLLQKQRNRILNILEKNNNIMKKEFYELIRKAGIVGKNTTQIKKFIDNMIKENLIKIKEEKQENRGRPKHILYV